MKPKHYGPTIFMLMLFTVFVRPGNGSALAEDKLLPLPVGEAAEVMENWFGDTGFLVRQTPAPQTGHRAFYAVKAQEKWEVTLTPHSALATRISICFSGSQQEAKLQQLWNHLLNYLHAPVSETSRPPVTGIPPVVLSKIESVVCINARLGDKEVQFSGFIVDENGLVLCTAHDLTNSQNLTVTLYDGQEFKGKILYKDKHQDLSVIHIPIKPTTAINLIEGRNLLGMGETVFTVGCPVNMRGTVHSGTINGPPRRVDALPLWQAHMEIYPGSSGSPVFDAEGNLVAVVKGRYRGTASMGFLIPLETIINFLKEKHPS